jgi:hypothetical protein
MATIKSKVLQLLGENNSSYLSNVSNPEYIVETGVWGIAGSIPKRLLMADASEPVDPEVIPSNGSGGHLDTLASPTSIEDKIVLLVTRTQTDYSVTDSTVTARNYITRQCREIPYEDSFKAKDGTSIYYATNYSPVYWVENIAGVPSLNVAPSAAGTTNSEFLSDHNNNGSAIQVFSYPRQLFYNAGTSPTAWAHTTAYAVGDKVSYSSKNYVCIGAHTSTNDAVVATGKPDTAGSTVWRLSWEFVEKIDNVPEEIQDLFVMRIALEILSHKLGNLATQEEDTEIYNLTKDLHNTIFQKLGAMLGNLQGGNQEDKKA